MVRRKPRINLLFSIAVRMLRETGLTSLVGRRSMRTVTSSRGSRLEMFSFLIWVSFHTGWYRSRVSREWRWAVAYVAGQKRVCAEGATLAFVVGVKDDESVLEGHHDTQ